MVATERNEKEKKLALKSISKCLKEKSIEGLVECSEIVKEKVQRFINEPKNLLGLAFLHSRDSKDFNGRFQGFEGSEHVTIGYWSIEEPESCSVDKTVSVISFFFFFAEAMIGAILFILNVFLITACGTNSFHKISCDSLFPFWLKFFFH